MAGASLTGVTKEFSQGRRRAPVLAVDRIDFDVSDGELVVLLGPSGCGKTTTLRLIAGLEELTAGEIRIADRVVNDVRPKDRDVGLVFQHHALYPHLNVYDNLAFGLRMRRVPKDEIKRRVLEVARLLGIGTLLDRRAHQISGGQQQRVALGRAMARRPSLYLLDEPLANLDAQLRVRVRLELKRYQQDLGMTAVYVTHDQQEAMSLADRLVVMNDGRVLQFDRPEAVYRCPANRFVAGFLGSPAMNFLDGRLAEAGGRLVFETRSGVVGLPDRFRACPGVSAGAGLVLGVRAGDVSLRAPAVDADGLAGVVTMKLLRDDRTELHLRLSGGDEWVALAPFASGVAPGDRVSVALNVLGLLLFESGPCGANVEVAMQGRATDAA